MKYLPPIILLTATIAAGYAAAESTVYESVNQQGSPSFSDQPSPGAKKVEIKPNVVNVTPVKSLGPPSSPKATKTQKTPGPDLKPVVVQSGTDVEYNHTINRRLNAKKRLQNTERPVQLPARKPTQKPVQRPSIQPAQ